MATLCTLYLEVICTACFNVMQSVHNTHSSYTWRYGFVFLSRRKFSAFCKCLSCSQFLCQVFAICRATPSRLGRIIVDGKKYIDSKQISSKVDNVECCILGYVYQYLSPQYFLTTLSDILKQHFQFMADFELRRENWQFVVPHMEIQ